MKREVSRKILESLCAELGLDDGVDPRNDLRVRSPRQSKRKDWQLCRQVTETVNLVLSGDLNDDVLRSVYVAKAEPAPDATRVLVTVAPLPAGGNADLAEIASRLQAASKRLRHEVAHSISRRKAPELVFRVITNDSVMSPNKSTPQSDSGVEE